MYNPYSVEKGKRVLKSSNEASEAHPVHEDVEEEEFIKRAAAEYYWAWHKAIQRITSAI